MIEQLLTSLFSFLLPGSFSETINHQVISIEITSPKINEKNVKDLNITAKSALLIDIDTGDILFKKNEKEKRSPASLTKILTALVILKKEPLNKIYIVPEKVRDINGSKNHIKPGERISVRNLLAMTLIESSNQAAYTLAINFSGNEEKYLKDILEVSINDAIRNAAGVLELYNIEDGYFSPLKFSDVVRLVYGNVGPRQLFEIGALYFEDPIAFQVGWPDLTLIKGKDLIKEYGGGLCQVSTTMFRAAMYSGLEITERFPHSLPVSYYNPQGFDAAIYGPHPDFRFINDTNSNVLVQTRIKGTKLFFEF